MNNNAQQKLLKEMLIICRELDNEVCFSEKHILRTKIKEIETQSDLLWKKRKVIDSNLRLVKYE